MQSLLLSNSHQRNCLETKTSGSLLSGGRTWRNTSGSFSVWCSSLRHLPFTSTKWGWLCPSTPFVNSHHSSRKESLTTAAMGQGRAVATKEPPTQCLLIKFSLMQSRLLYQDPSLPPPVVATCSSQPRPPHTPYLVPEFGSGMLACQGQPWLTVVTAPLHLNVAFPIVLSSHRAASQFPVAGWMCGLLIWGLLEPSQLGTCGWLTRPPVSDFHLVSFFTKICLIFIPLPCGWIDFKDVLSYVILFCSFGFGLNNI